MAPPISILRNGSPPKPSQIALDAQARQVSFDQSPIEHGWSYRIPAFRMVELLPQRLDRYEKRQLRKFPMIRAAGMEPYIGYQASMPLGPKLACEEAAAIGTELVSNTFQELSVCGSSNGSSGHEYAGASASETDQSGKPRKLVRFADDCHDNHDTTIVTFHQVVDLTGSDFENAENEHLVRAGSYEVYVRKSRSNYSERGQLCCNECPSHLQDHIPVFKDGHRRWHYQIRSEREGCKPKIVYRLRSWVKTVRLRILHLAKTPTPTSLSELTPLV